jgi:RNA polymerase sigma factor (sigma-70 family)
MMSASAATLVNSLKRALSDEELARQGDQELVARFARHQDQAAFAALVKRHGALVSGVCRRILRDHALAEDAFQAVFIILAKKAGAIRKRDAVASWLFGVAQRVARQARRRRQREHDNVRRAAENRRPANYQDLRWEATLALMEEELGRLPTCYRAPLLACYLEGRTQDEAARELGWPLGTLRRRLDKGREILKARLTRQGIAWSAGLFSLGLSMSVTEAAVLHELRQRTVQAALCYLKGDGVSQGVAIMVQGGLRWAAGTTWHCLAAGVILCCGLAGVGAVWPAPQAAPQPEKEAKRVEALEPPIAARKPSAKPASDGLPEGAIARLGSLRFNHGEGLRSLHYTPDGKTVVSYGGGFIRLWDTESGWEIKQFPVVKGSSLADGDTVLLADGKTLLETDLRYDKLRYWNLARGNEIRSVDVQVRSAIRYGTALSPDGQLIAAHTQEGVNVLETATGELRFATNRRGDQVQKVIFSGDSKSLIQSSKDGVIELWDAATGKPHKIFDQSPPAVVLVASRDGRWLATLEHHNYAIDKHLENDVIHLWDLDQAKEIHKFAAKGWFMRLCFTPDSKQILAYGSIAKGYSRHGWDIVTGAELTNPPPALGSATAFHPDGKRFITGGGNRFDEWNLTSGKRTSSEEPRHSRANALRFDAAGERIITLGYDCITTWDATTGKRLRSFDIPLYQYYDPRPILSADGKLALTYQHASKPYSIDMLVWDVASGKKTSLSLGDPPSVYVNAQHHISPWFTPDDKQLVVLQPGANNTGAIRIWDLTTGKEIKQIPHPNAALRSAFLFADGKTLIVPGNQAVGIDVPTGNEVFAWDAPVRVPSAVRTEFVAKGGGQPQLIPEGPAWQCFAISPDGKTAAYMLSTDNGSERVPDRIILCDGRTGKLLHRLDDSGRRGRDLGHLLFSPDGRWLVSSDRKVAHVWNVATGAKVRTLDGHRGDIEAFTFSQTGHRLATASADGTVLIWDLADLPR